MSEKASASYFGSSARTSVPGFEVEGDEAGGVRVAGVEEVDPLPVLREADGAARKSVFGTPRHELPPFVVLALSDEEFGAAVGGHALRGAYFVVFVGEPPDEVAEVLGDEAELPGRDREAEDIVEARVAAVHHDEGFVREILARREDARLNAVERREVARLLRFGVHGVDAPVFVSVGVLQIKEMLPVLRPKMDVYPSLPVVGDRLEIIFSDAPDPYVEDSVHGGDVREAFPVGGEARLCFVRVPEENLAGYDPGFRSSFFHECLLGGFRVFALRRSLSEKSARTSGR
jgi:hypothetical protein